MKSKYKYLRDWYKADPKAYGAADRKGMISEICQAMGWVETLDIIWTKELCIYESLKHTTKFDWIINDSESCKAALDNGWMTECTAHMNKENYIQFSLIKENYIKEKCINKAKNCQTPIEWKIYDFQTYRLAKKNKWLAECTAHMVINT